VACTMVVKHAPVECPTPSHRRNDRRTPVERSAAAQVFSDPSRHLCIAGAQQSQCLSRRPGGRHRPVVPDLDHGADPLAWHEMASAGWITGITWSDLHFRLRTCTHLNAVLRIVDDAGNVLSLGRTPPGVTCAVRSRRRGPSRDLGCAAMLQLRRPRGGIPPVPSENTSLAGHSAIAMPGSPG
jgi:hypothetical protein